MGSFPSGNTFTMGPLDLTVTATDLSVTVPISGIEHVEIGLLRLTDDTWQGSGLAASQNIRAFSGNDAVTSGGLDDVLVGGTSNDTLTGNAGADVLQGGDGNDTIQSPDALGRPGPERQVVGLA